MKGPKDANGQPEYTAFVHYWMPFNGGVGIHDLASRGNNFGGDIYKNQWLPRMYQYSAGSCKNYLRDSIGGNAGNCILDMWKSRFLNGKEKGFETWT